MKLGKTYFSGSLTFDEGNNFIGPNTSVLTGSLSGSVKGTFEGSFAGDTLTNISGAFDAVSASIASDRLKNTTDTLTGDLTVTGTLTAQDLHVQEITSSVLYSSGSNIFGNDSTNTHTFTGTGSFDAVGIGIANPTTTLDINGGFKWNGVARLTDLAYFVGSSTYGFRFNSAADDNNNVIFYNDGKSYFRGSVGIGTTSPENYYTGADNLVIYQASGEAGITVATADDTSGALYFADGTTGDAEYRGGIAYTHSTEVLSLVSGGSTKMVISGSGNVGIASNSPNYRLEVKGSSESIIASIDHDALGGRQVGLPHRFMIGGIGQNYPEIGYNYTTQNSTYTKIQEDTAWAINFGSSNRMSFKYAASGTGAFSFTELVVINSAGKVGIGNTSPSAPLTVGNYSSTHHQNHSSLPTVPGNHLVNLTPPSTTNYYGGGISWSEGTNTAASLGVYDAGAGGALGMYFATGDNTTLTERMRITSGGTVKIGDGTYAAQIHFPTPTYNNYIGYDGSLDGLQIATNGEIKFQAGSGYAERMRIDSSGLATFKKSGTNARFYDGSTSSTGAIEFGQSDFIFGYDSGVFKHKIWDGADYFNAIEYNGPSHRLILAPSEGSVGIGTTSPGGKLDVVHPNSGTDETRKEIQRWLHDGQNAMSLFAYGNTADTIQLAAWGSEQNISIVTETLGSIAKDTTKGIYIKSGGNVGIGTTSPSAKLDILQGSASPVALEINTENTFCDVLMNSFYSTSATRLRVGTNDFQIHTNGGQNLTVTSGGSVGIGVTNPQANLDVDQDLRVNRYHKNVFSYYSTDSVSNQYFHIKTGVGTNQVCMHMYHVEGYAYGQNAIIDERFGFHTDSGGTIYGKSYKGTYANNIYASSDNKVVLVFGTMTTYYASFMVHLIESGMYSELFVKPSAATYSSSNSGAY